MDSIKKITFIMDSNAFSIQHLPAIELRVYFVYEMHKGRILLNSPQRLNRPQGSRHFVIFQTVFLHEPKKKNVISFYSTRSF